MPATGPLLRWTGGKRRLLTALSAALPHHLSSYYEPFIGAGALFFSLGPVGPRQINDINTDLITAYRVLRDRTDDLIGALRVLAQDTSETAYYRMRSRQPVEPVEVAARFIYLNRLCFQGLWRENRRGEMNVPYGHLLRPTVLDEPLVRASAEALAGVEITCGSYVDAVATAGPSSFIYVDPPYCPASPTADFTAYHAGGFDLDDQRTLADVIADLDARGVRVMLSNSDTPETRRIYRHLRLHTVAVRRSVAARGSARREVTEVIGVNYPMSEMRDPDAFAALAVAVDTH